MINIVSIVEGDGEVAALPILLRRINEWKNPEVLCNVFRPIRVRREQFLNREDIFVKQLQIAAALAEDDGWVLILLDADDDCPKELASQVWQRAIKVIPHRRVSVVLANREFEAWFIASVESFNGRRGFVLGGAVAPDAETIRGGKEWLSKHIPDGKYHEVTDQPAFAALINLEKVHEKSRSFRKLCKEWVAQNESVFLKLNES